MFVYYYVQVEGSFDDVEGSVLRMLPGLRGWAEQAYRDGEQLRARINSSGGERIAKTVLIEVGAPARGATETWIPISWVATGAPGLFPSMDADVVVGRIGDELTQISLRGSYRVPLGPLGRVLDKVGLHRIAESSVKSFVDRIAEAVPELDRERLAGAVGSLNGADQHGAAGHGHRPAR